MKYFQKIIKTIHNHNAEKNESRIDFLKTSCALLKFPAPIFCQINDIAAIQKPTAGKYAKNSKRKAKENAVAPGSKNLAETIYIKIASPIGLITWVNAAGIQISNTFFIESFLIERFFHSKNIFLFLLDRTFIAIIMKIVWETNVAYAAPATHKAGKPSFQNIKIGSRMIFTSVDTANNFVTVKVSHSALNIIMIFMRKNSNNPPAETIVKYCKAGW